MTKATTVEETKPSKKVFQAGFSVRAGSVYAEREADGALQQSLLDGGVSYVFEPRQIGKSSLRIRTAAKLAPLRCIQVDLNGIGGSEIGERQFYNALSKIALSEIAPDLDGTKRWRDFPDGTPPHERWLRIFREHALAQGSGRVVLFIDEVDWLLDLPVDRGRFFNLQLELCQSHRAFSVCFTGAAATRQLADGSKIFSMPSRRIRLHDFTRSQLSPFAEGLRTVSDHPEAVLDEIFKWAHGHPYWTQKLCQHLVKSDRITLGCEAGAVEQLAVRLFVEGLKQDEPMLDSNIATAQLRVLSTPLAPQLLDAYGQILQAGSVPVEKEDPDEVWELLRLTGLVAERCVDGKRGLFVRNRIIESAFDKQWLLTQQKVHAAP